MTRYFCGQHFKQKNKRFKRAQKINYKKNKINLTHKKIKKQKKVDRKNRLIQCKIHKQQSKTLKTQVQNNTYIEQITKNQLLKIVEKQPTCKIIVIIPFNQHANAFTILELIKTYMLNLNNNNSSIILNILAFYLTLKNVTIIQPVNTLKKKRFLFIASDRNLQHILDYCKVADIICPLLSSKGTQPNKIKIDPDKYANAFDDLGYKALTCIRAQGLISHVSILQDIIEIDSKHRQSVQKLYRRYFQSQFGGDYHITLNNQNQLSKFLRLIQNRKSVQIDWRQMRSYVLAEKVKYEEQNLILKVEGILKGNCLNSNQLIHITGIDDFQLECIEIVSLNTNNNVNNKTKLIQYSFNPQPLTIFNPNQTTLEERQEQIQTILGQMTINQNIIKHQQIEQQFQQQNEDVQLEQNQLHQNFIKKNRFQLQIRNQDELQIEDEKQYQPDQILRNKFKKYHGLKSFRQSNWNPRQNLPDFYQKIYIFNNFTKIKKIGYQQVKKKGFAYKNSYVKLTIKNFTPNHFNLLKTLNPIVLYYYKIISSLFKHQRKMTVLQMRVKRLPDIDQEIISKQKYLIQYGFRRIYTNVIFSRCYPKCQKNKYVKRIKDSSNYYYCSFYFCCLYPPSNCLIFRKSDMQNKVCLMIGNFLKNDPLHVILKRTILTGYPHKINKKRAIIKFMFFNPQDVKYFKPVQLITKLGLIGKIQQSLGTHGLMKCLFNNVIKQHDTVCLYLYKRVFPKQML